MACFAVSAVAGVGVAVMRHIVKHHENQLVLAGRENPVEKFGSDVKWSKKLGYLELTLFSGSFVLAAEHIIHGEVVPFPPFLTAMESAEETAEMWQEIGTVGVGMFVILLIAWAIATFAIDLFKYRKRKQTTKLVEE